MNAGRCGMCEAKVPVRPVGRGRQMVFCKPCLAAKKREWQRVVHWLERHPDNEDAAAIESELERWLRLLKLPRPQRSQPTMTFNHGTYVVVEGTHFTVVWNGSMRGPWSSKGGLFV